MAKSESETGPSEQSFGPGHGPQTLPQLQATGAEVVGSDGEKIGDLKEVSDADFRVGRTLRRDLHVPVARVKKVTTDNQIVLDLTADEANNMGWDRPSGETDPAADFSESSEREKGAWGLRRED